jgi:hypothetical protein
MSPYFWRTPIAAEQKVRSIEFSDKWMLNQCRFNCHLCCCYAIPLWFRAMCCTCTQSVRNSNFESRFTLRSHPSFC